MSGEEEAVGEGGDEGVFVPYTEVRREALGFLASSGYRLEADAMDASWGSTADGNWERKVAERDVEPGVLIHVTERPPNPEIRVYLVRVLGGISKPISRPRKMSYRNPERVRAYLPRVEADLLEGLRTRCPHCGGPMAERKVKNPESKNAGKTFLGCLRYPECRGAVAEWIPRAASDDGKMVGAACPDCGSPLVVRYVKREDLPHRGQSFIGCSGYPKCRRIVTREELMALRFMAPREEGEGEPAF